MCVWNAGLNKEYRSVDWCCWQTSWKEWRSWAVLSTFSGAATKRELSM